MATISAIANITGPSKTMADSSPLMVRGLMNINSAQSTKYHASTTSPTSIPVRALMNINSVKTTTWNTTVVDITGLIPMRNLSRPLMTNIYTTRVNQNGKAYDVNAIKVFGDEPIREFWI